MVEVITAPKVFISYAWTNEEYKRRVISFAKRLVTRGIDVVADFWDLKEGQEKYSYMERCVLDHSISNVLLLCNREYKERADKRRGGVGAESTIISPEIYSSVKQTKFIPVAFDQEDGELFFPSFISTRIYEDLSTDEKIEDRFEVFARKLLGIPEHVKPKLGNPNDFIPQEGDLPVERLDSFRRKIEVSDKFTGAQKIKLRRDLNLSVLTILKQNKDIDGYSNKENILKKIDRLKPVRDSLLLCIEAMALSNFDAAPFMKLLLETIYNELAVDDSSSYKATYVPFEDYCFFAYEMVICVSIILYKYERFDDLKKMLTQLYSLYSYRTTSSKKWSCTVSQFVMPFRGQSGRESCLRETVITPNGSQYAKPAGVLALRRTKENLISRQEIIYTDLLLCQLSLIYAENSKLAYAPWIPLCGDWCDDYEAIWEDLYSADFCEKAYKLFNVDIPTQIALKIMQYPIPKECLGDGFVVFGGEEPRYSAIAERIGALP